MPLIAAGVHARILTDTRSRSRKNHLSKLIFDPEALAIESIGSEPAVAVERLTRDWLRERFVDPPEWEQEKFDERWIRTSTADPTPAAVLMPLVAREDGVSLLLTQRTAHLND